MPSDDVFGFQCPQCQHRLKAKRGAAGRRAKCPRCQQSLVVPTPPAPKVTAPKVTELRSEPPSTDKPAAANNNNNNAASPSGPRPIAAIDRNGWLNLGEPAIGDLSERQQLYESNRQDKERERMARVHKQQARHRSQMNSTVGSAGKPAHTESPPPENPPRENNVKRSVFDDDLPELSELQKPSRRSRSIEDLLSAHVGESQAASQQLSDLVPELAPIPKDKAQQRLGRVPHSATPDGSDPEYRIACQACGTVQYVRISQKGQKIQCPDCHLKFPIPAPPPGWKPNPQAEQRDSQNDWHTLSGDGLQAADSQHTQRSRAARMLEQADQQALDEDLDRLYEDDFDTANFVQRTFGFLKDPVVLAYIFGYAIIFAGIFAVGQLAVNEAETHFGKGLMLVTFIGAPVVGLLFALPMLSGGIALIESVANGQQRVADWPNFNLFDNAGDMLAITVALLGSVIPGFLLGSWLGGEDPGAGRIQIAGMMASSLFLFPVFLLSMLDNGSLFAPLSSAVISSFHQATEAWAAYLLKTSVAFATILLLWLLLLGEGKPIALAAIAGCLLPLLIFFTCQQIGALAGSISEHLSFEFVPPDADDDTDDV